MIRSIKRQMLKKELGTNDISEEFHKRNGYKPTNDYLEFYSVFGVPCLVSKVLSGLQFEVR